MAPKALANVLDRLKALAALHQANQCSDPELLRRFVERHDEAAFTALVERHGPMVLRVCRRVLRHHQDAEDACQATFLVLVRKAASIRKLNALGSWLHGVACRVALKLRAQLARSPRPLADLQACREERGASLSWSERDALLDEELQRLPEKYRTPLVLCYLQARTRDEAAQELGWKPSTFKGRLEWGRRLLRQRLARRGVALSAALLVAGLTQPASAAVPAPLAVAVVRSALEIVAGKTLAAGLVSPQVAALAQGFLRTMFFKQLQMGAGVVLMALFLAGTGWLAHQVLAQEPATAGAAEIASRSPPDADRKPGPAPREVATAPQGEKPNPLPDEPPLLQRGEHLVRQVARCGECHTPRDAKGELNGTRHLQGGRVPFDPKIPPDEWDEEAPDITAGGLAGKWSEEKMVKFLSAGAKECPPAAVPRLTAEDARAITAYLRSLPGKKKGEGKRGG